MPNFFENVVQYGVAWLIVALVALWMAYVVLYLSAALLRAMWLSWARRQARSRMSKENPSSDLPANLQRDGSEPLSGWKWRG